MPLSISGSFGLRIALQPALCAGDDRFGINGFDLKKPAEVTTEARHRREHAEQSETVQAAFQPATILVVDDEHVVASIVGILLQSSGHNVISATSPLEALRLAEGMGEKLDLIITDFAMPEMDGVRLQRRARELCPTTKLIYMSGYSLKMLVKRGIDTNVTPWIHSGGENC